MNLYLAVNETKAVLDELERDQKYLYSVSATNEIGLFTLSEGKSLGKRYKSFQSSLYCNKLVFFQ